MTTPSHTELLLETSMTTLHDNVIRGFELAFSKDHKYTLLREEDFGAWIIFGTVFALLMMFDHFVLNRSAEQLTIVRALHYTLFWILTAFAFCGWVWYQYGQANAFMWISGYMLEWMLSFDNLFVFHLIFTVYGTPDHLKHRPLYLGICGAVVFRMLFIFIGEYMMRAMMFMHFVFGAFLVYTGVKTITADEDDEDPSQNILIKWLQSKVPFVSAYDSQGAFFVRVAVDDEDNVILPKGCIRLAEQSELGGRCPEAGSLLCTAGQTQAYGSVDFKQIRSKMAQESTPIRSWQLRATMLFLVVCCLEISDLIFAIDSVSAIVAQVNDFFLAYTSAVFAMLGLRATFFIIDVLVHMFSLLKYGVASVLVFIGVKLILAHHYTIEPDAFAKKAAGHVPEDVVKRVTVVKEKMPPSPYPPIKLPAA